MYSLGHWIGMEVHDLIHDSVLGDSRRAVCRCARHVLGIGHVVKVACGLASVVSTNLI